MGRKLPQTLYVTISELRGGGGFANRSLAALSVHVTDLLEHCLQSGGRLPDHTQNHRVIVAHILS